MRFSKPLLVCIAFSGLCALTVGACGGGSATTANDTGDGGDQGTDGGGGDGPGSVNGGPGSDGSSNDKDGTVEDTKPQCDLTKDPSASAPCVDDAFAVFVDATNGNDANPGTKAAPFASIGQALKSVGGKPRVYVCAGNYVENVALTNAAQPSLYGGFACGTWTITAGSTVAVAPTAGVAFSTSGTSVPVTIADMSFTSVAGATSDAPNSVAGTIKNSTNIILKRVTFTAGDGFTQGAADPLVTNHVVHGTGGNASNGAVKSAGGKTVCACVDGTSSQGANGGSDIVGTVLAPISGLPALSVNAGANNAACVGGGGTGGGGAAAVALAADPPLAKAGAVDAVKGWLPTGGKIGTFGKPGQGGGGGGDGPAQTGLGSGGGCGGCGGHGGFAGLGGGASIALLVVESAVSSVQSTFISGNGGAGGSGGQGESGQAPTGAGTEVSPGCPGGGGGAGSSANGGGGGAGGSAFGILFSNAVSKAAVTIDGVAAVTAATHAGVTLGAGGTVGTAGPAGAASGNSAAGNDGPAGPAGVVSAIQNAADL